MAVHTLQVTLGAAKTQISATRIPVRQVMIQNNAAHSCRAGDINVTTTRGALLASGSPGGTVNAGTFEAYNTDLIEWWIIGTNADVIDVIYIS